MEIELLLQNHLAQSQQYQSLFQKLITQSQNCIHKITQSTPSPEELQEKTKQCNKKVNHFSAYFQLYKKQFIEKGEQICLNQLEQIPLESKSVQKKEAFQKNVRSMLEKQRDCIKFYSKSKNVFQENVNDKLRTLVDGLAFNEL